jgi:hypothetical protein
MCPACITTVALIAAGAGSTGGLTALLARKLRVRRDDKRAAPKTRTTGAEDGSTESGIAG